MNEGKGQSSLVHQTYVAATDDKEAGAPVPVAAKALDFTASLPLPRSTEPLMLSPVRYRKKISTGTPPTSGSSSGGSTPVAVTKKIVSVRRLACDCHVIIIFLPFGNAARATGTRVQEAPLCKPTDPYEG